MNDDKRDDSEPTSEDKFFELMSDESQDGPYIERLVYKIQSHLIILPYIFMVILLGYLWIVEYMKAEDE